MKLRLLALFAITLSLLFLTSVYASRTNGTIDPEGQGNYIVNFFDAPDVGNGNGDTRINFGKFTTQDAYNIHVTDDGLYGFAWGVISGYIAMNCTDTTSGCTDGNGEFRVDVARDGTLSGFAWGENTGWVNFGPFTNDDVAQVQIDSDGYFKGVGSDVGYAWSENFGWIEFDCTDRDTCVHTDYRPARYRPSEGESSGGSVTQCRNHVDDDGDGYTDDEDPQCADGGSSEYPDPVTPPVTPVPGTTTPQNPPTNPTPTTPTTPTTTPASPAQPDPTPGEPQEFPNEQEPENPGTPVVTPIVNTITDVVNGDVGAPEARDRVMEFLRSMVESIKHAFDVANRALVSFMKDDQVKGAVSTAAEAGLIAAAGFALALLAIAPVAGAGGILLFPYLLWQSLMGLLGFVPSVRPWGVVYNNATHQPLALAHISIIDAYGAVAATTVTRADGSFSAHVPDGNYTVRVDGQNGALAAAAAPLIYGTVYASQPVSIRNNQPATQFDVAVAGAATPARSANSLQSFLVSHEVLITNISLALFGVGFLASVLNLIFFPSLVSTLMCAAYVAIALLRGVGVFGSYASVFTAKAGGAPLAGKLVTVFESFTNTPVAKTLTSNLGRAYLDLPEGHFYTVVSDPSLPAGEGMTTMSQPFATHAGLYRKNFSV